MGETPSLASWTEQNSFPQWQNWRMTSTFCSHQVPNTQFCTQLLHHSLPAALYLWGEGKYRNTWIYTWGIKSPNDATACLQSEVVKTIKFWTGVMENTHSPESGCRKVPAETFKEGKSRSIFWRVECLHLTSESHSLKKWMKSWLIYTETLPIKLASKFNSWNASGNKIKSQKWCDLPKMANSTPHSLTWIPEIY